MLLPASTGWVAGRARAATGGRRLAAVPPRARTVFLPTHPPCCTASQIVTNLYIDAFVGLLCLSGFILFRSKCAQGVAAVGACRARSARPRPAPRGVPTLLPPLHPRRFRIYTNRLVMPQVPESKRPPPMRLGGHHQLWSWLVPVFTLSDGQLLRSAGLDALVRSVCVRGGGGESLKLLRAWCLGCMRARGRQRVLAECACPRPPPGPTPRPPLERRWPCASLSLARRCAFLSWCFPLACECAQGRALPSVHRRPLPLPLCSSPVK